MFFERRGCGRSAIKCDDEVVDVIGDGGMGEPLDSRQTPRRDPVLASVGNRVLGALGVSSGWV
jgi:hypothetical protein